MFEPLSEWSKRIMAAVVVLALALAFLGRMLVEAGLSLAALGRGSHE
ncbi:MAG: hypothetical protein ACOY93_09320 [Bacillota bacterium]